MKNPPAKKNAAPKRPAPERETLPTIGDETPATSAAHRRAEQEANRIRDMMERLRGEEGSTIEIYRKTVSETEYSFLEELDSTDFDKSRIEGVYGGGYYEVKGRSADGTFVSSFRFKIDTLIPAKNPRAPAPTPPPQESAVKEIAKIIEPLARQISERPQPQTDPLLLAMIKGQQDMMTALLSKREDSSPVLMTLVTELKEMRRELNEVKAGGRGGRGESIESALAIIDRIEERTGGRGGGGSDDKDEKPSFGEALGKGLAMVAVQYFGGGQGGPQFPLGGQPNGGQPVRVTPRPAPGAGPNAAAPATPAGNGVAAAGPVIDADVSPMPNPLVKQYIEQFASSACEAAEDERDAFEFIGSVFTFAPGVAHSTMFEIANSPNWIERAFPPPYAERIKPHAKWLEEVRDAVLEKMFIAHCKGAYAQKWDAEQTVAQFAQNVSPEFYRHMTTLKDPDEIQEAFDNAPGKQKLPDTFIEQIRAVIEKGVKPVEQAKEK